MDTMLTISITLTCGFFWGAACGMLTNLFHHAFFGFGWEGYLFIICNIATAYITRIFMRLFPGELNLCASIIQRSRTPAQPAAVQKTAVYKSNLFGRVMDRVIVLIILSFALCLAMSFLGGFIAAVIMSISPSYNYGGSGITALFSTTMFKGNTHVLVAEIVSRIPVNIVDRLISTFGGFGIALCFRRLKNALKFIWQT